MPGMIDIAALKQAREGEQQNFHIEQQTVVFNIPGIVLKPGLPGDRVTPIDLSPAGNTRPDVVPQGLTGRIQRQVFHQQRPRPDQTHIALQHVEQLRQLVEAAASQPGSKWRHALRIGQQLARRITGFQHGTKLEKRKRNPVQAWPSLTDQNGRTHCDMDCQRGQKHERRAQHQQQKRGHRIE